MLSPALTGNDHFVTPICEASEKAHHHTSSPVGFPGSAVVTAAVVKA